MAKDSEWYKSKGIRLNNKLNTIIIEFPYFARSYIINKQSKLAVDTLISYAYSIQSFLKFLVETKSDDSVKTIHDLKIDVMKTIGEQELIAYEKYLKQESKVITYRTLTYKFSILRGLYNYIRSKDWVKTNPFDNYRVSVQEVKKEVEHLTVEEIRKLFSSVINLSNCKSKHQAAYLEKSQMRDYTILLLILNTGIRISECQGLDIQDVDLKECRLNIVRGKSKQSYVYFNNEVCDVLKYYLAYRKQIEPKFENDPALFLSMRRTRMSIRAIQKLMLKITPTDIEDKSVTPRTLRNTYGVELYKETKDVQLVGTILGCQTKAFRYAETAKPDKRNAANAVKLSEKTESKG